MRIKAFVSSRRQALQVWTRRARARCHLWFLRIDPFYEWHDGVTALHSAARGNWPEGINLLCCVGANVNGRDVFEETPLFRLVSAWAEEPRRDYSQTYAELIRQGACVNLGKKSGVSPLHMAARAGNIEICRHLLDDGADAYAIAAFRRDVLATPLHIAVLNGFLPLCRFFVERGVDAMRPHENMQNAIELAASLDKVDIVRIFVEVGRCNPAGWSNRPLIDFAPEGEAVYRYLMSFKRSRETTSAVTDAIGFAAGSGRERRANVDPL